MTMWRIARNVKQQSWETVDHQLGIVIISVDTPRCYSVSLCRSLNYTEPSRKCKGRNDRNAMMEDRLTYLSSDSAIAQLCEFYRSNRAPPDPNPDSAPPASKKQRTEESPSATASSSTASYIFTIAKDYEEEEDYDFPSWCDSTIGPQYNYSHFVIFSVLCNWPKWKTFVTLSLFVGRKEHEVAGKLALGSVEEAESRVSECHICLFC